MVVPGDASGPDTRKYSRPGPLRGSALRYSRASESWWPSDAGLRRPGEALLAVPAGLGLGLGLDLGLGLGLGLGFGLGLG